MKHTKKLIPALGMLLLSASMLVTSTFAWFSVNLEVKANNMTVSAVGDQVYLQIAAGKLTKAEGEGDEVLANFTAGAAHKEADGTTSNVKLLPSTVVKNQGDATSFGKADYEANKYTGGTYSWVTTTSDAIDSSAATSDYKVVTTGAYYHMNSFVIRLNEEAGNTTANGALRVNGINLSNNAATGAGQDFSKCVSVLVVCDGYTQLWKQGSANAWAEVEGVENGNWGKLTADKFASTTGVQVDVYVFFDGQNPDCTIADFTAAGVDAAYIVSVSFTVA